MGDWFSSPIYWVVVGALVVGIIVLVVVRNKQQS